jgi:cell division septal protein FtsQ
VSRTGWRNERAARTGRSPSWRVRAVIFAAALGAGVCGGALRGEALLARAFPERAAQVRLAVLGNEHAAAFELAAAAEVGPGTRLASLDLARVRAGVAAHPWVREARVAALPPDLLLIAVTEREPVAQAKIGGTSWLVDRTGRAFLLAAPGAALPVLIGATAPDDARLAEGVAWLEALAAHGIAAPAQLVLAGPEPTLALAANAPAPGARVLLGKDERDAQLARLARLLAAGLPELATAAEIDLRFGADVILRPRPEAALANKPETGGAG